MSSLKDAVEAYQHGQYYEALYLFERAAEKYGFELVKQNISKCIYQVSKENKLVGANDKDLPLLGQDHSEVISRNFDHVYLVNLEHMVKRRLCASAQLRRHGISFSLFRATDGYRGDLYQRYLRYASGPLGALKRFKAYNDREVRRGAKFIESAGAFGYIDTYLRILADAKRRFYRRILIMEDDVILHPQFTTRLAILMSQVPDAWKIIQLGASQYNWASVDEDEALEAGYYLPRSLDTCGSFAICVDSSVYDELIEAQSAFEAPFDHLPMGEIYERHLGSCFVAYPNLVMPDVSESSIRGGRDQEEHGKRMKWRTREYVHPLPPPSVAIQLTSATNARYIDQIAQDRSLSFDARFYVHTEDGVRPLHGQAYFDLPSSADVRRAPASSLPSADAYAWVAPDEVVTERDVRNFLEAAMLGRFQPSALNPISQVPSPVVNGRVSVIIPTFARASNLMAALRSVVSQNYPDIQIVVVSDNEPGGEEALRTHSVVNSFKAENPRADIIFIQHRSNRNGAAARNTGVMNSNGEYICFLDDDDIYLPGRISSAVSELRRQPPKVGAVYCGFVGWNSPSEDASRYKPGNLTRDLLLLEYKNHYLHTNTTTYRRDAFWAINGFDETYRRHQDLEFNLRFFRRYDIGVVKHIGVRLNPAPSSVSNKIFNMDFFNLKRKFLEAFVREIEALGCEASDVYDRHWNEVVRYTDDRESVLAHLRQMKDNGPLQVFMRTSVGRL